MGRMRIVIECGTHSPWVSRLLQELGHEVIVANPRRLRLISESDRKNDKADARLLAKMARRHLICSHLSSTGLNGSSSTWRLSRRVMRRCLVELVS